MIKLLQKCYQRKKNLFVAGVINGLIEILKYFPNNKQLMNQIEKL